MPAADVGATLGPEAPFCLDDLNRNDMSAVFGGVYARQLFQEVPSASGDRSTSQSSSRRAMLHSAKTSVVCMEVGVCRDVALRMAGGLNAS